MRLIVAASSAMSVVGASKGRRWSSEPSSAAERSGFAWTAAKRLAKESSSWLVVETLSPDTARIMTDEAPGYLGIADEDTTTRR